MKRKLALVKAAASLPAKGGAKALLAEVRGMILEARQSMTLSLGDTFTVPCAFVLAISA